MPIFWCPRILQAVNNPGALNADPIKNPAARDLSNQTAPYQNRYNKQLPLYLPVATYTPYMNLIQRADEKHLSSYRRYRTSLCPQPELLIIPLHGLCKRARYVSMVLIKRIWAISCDFIR
jgi:hypothetical protein